MVLREFESLNLKRREVGTGDETRLVDSASDKEDGDAAFDFYKAGPQRPSDQNDAPQNGPCQYTSRPFSRFLGRLEVYPSGFPKAI